MSHPRDQHIVPEFLLKNFSSDGKKVWTFDKSAIKERWNNVKHRSISKTPTKEFIYDREKGVPNGSLEYKLRAIEDKSAPVVEKLIHSKSLIELTNSDKQILSELIAFQFLRTEESQSNISRIDRELNDFLKPHGINIKNDIEELWLNSLDKAHDFSQHFLGKSWCLSAGKQEYFISDNPIVRNNSTNIQKHRGTLGVNSKGIEIYFPISSSLVLCLFCPKTFPYEDTVIPATPECTTYLNWLQIRYSERFVFSQEKEFQLVYEMIKNGSL
ncbi:MAG: DUF4238 domain-containing protein [Crocinitomicaceae bacterium]|nr:DUF4238 domain-containing protein [Crocinitomicaceae bacterium]